MSRHSIDLTRSSEQVQLFPRERMIGCVGDREMAPRPLDLQAGQAT